MAKAGTDAEMEDDDVVVLDHFFHQPQTEAVQGDLSSGGPMRDLRSPRLRHTHHVLSQLRTYLSSTPDELNATLRCSDGDFHTSKVLLAAMSTFLRLDFSANGPAGLTPETVKRDQIQIWN